ncbi:lipoprotein UxpA [Pseudomonas putida]|nr:lipoprotein UxpA [Pseudomonas putida]
MWERVHPRTPAQPVPATVSPASRVNPLPHVLRRADRLR